MAIDRVNIEHRVFGKYPSVARAREVSGFDDDSLEAWVINVSQIPSIFYKRDNFHAIDATKFSRGCRVYRRSTVPKTNRLDFKTVIFPVVVRILTIK